MSKAVEEYIKNYTKHCSNANVYGSYEPWLTPCHAECVAEIARKETFFYPLYFSLHPEVLYSLQ